MSLVKDIHRSHYQSTDTSRKITHCSSYTTQKSVLVRLRTMVVCCCDPPGCHLNLRPFSFPFTFSTMNNLGLLLCGSPGLAFSIIQVTSSLSPQRKNAKT